MGVQADLDDADPLHDQRLLPGRHHAHGDVGVAPQQVGDIVGEGELDDQFGVVFAQSGEDGRQDLRADHVAGGDPHRAAHHTVPARDRAQQGGGGRRQHFCMRL